MRARRLRRARTCGVAHRFSVRRSNSAATASSSSAMPSAPRSRDSGAARPQSWRTEPTTGRRALARRRRGQIGRALVAGRDDPDANRRRDVARGRAPRRAARGSAPRSRPARRPASPRSAASRAARAGPNTRAAAAGPPGTSQTTTSKSARSWGSARRGRPVARARCRRRARHDPERRLVDLGERGRWARRARRSPRGTGRSTASRVVTSSEQRVGVDHADPPAAPRRGPGSPPGSPRGRACRPRTGRS